MRRLLCCFPSSTHLAASCLDQMGADRRGVLTERKSIHCVVGTVVSASCSSYVRGSDVVKP
jgi:hypothetical protein